MYSVFFGPHQGLGPFERVRESQYYVSRWGDLLAMSGRWNGDMASGECSQDFTQATQEEAALGTRNCVAVDLVVLRSNIAEALFMPAQTF